jgi:hypothetical protein
MPHFLKRLFADIDAIIWTLTSKAGASGDLLPPRTE